MRHLVLFLSYSILYCTSMHGQMQYDIHINDGLSYDYESEEGATWVASRGGLIRIDHITDEVEHFTPVNSGLNGIEMIEVEIAKDGTKWVCTRDDIYRYDGDDFERIDLMNEEFRGIANLRVSEEGTIWLRAFAENNQVALISYDDGILRRHENFFSDQILFFDLVSDSLVYVVTQGNSVFSYDGQVAREIIEPSDIEGIIREANLRQNGDLIFLSTGSNTVSAAKTLYKYSESEILKLHSDTLTYNGALWSTMAFEDDAYGNTWFQFYEHGTDSTYFLTVTDDTVLTHTYASLGIDIPHSSRPFILMDHDSDNNFWLRNYESRSSPRVYKANTEEVVSYNTNLTNINYDLGHSTIGEDCDGNIYASSYHSLSRFDGQEWTNFVYEDNGVSNPLNGSPSHIKLNPVTCEVWINTNYRIEPSFSYSTILKIIDGEYVFEDLGYRVGAIEFDAEGTAYILTPEGLLILDVDQNEEWIFEEDFPSERSFSNMTLGNDKDLWFHSNDRNIYKYHNGTWTTFSVEDHPFEDKIQLELHLDADNRLWTSYEDGLAVYDGSDWELIQADLGRFYPQNIASAGNGDILIASSDGLYIYDGLTIENLNMYNAPLCESYLRQVYNAQNDDVWLLHSVGVTSMRRLAPDSKHRIGGLVFYDSAQNGLYDLSEDVRLSGQKVVNAKTEEITFSNSTGGYAFDMIEIGESSVEIDPDMQWSSTSPELLEYNFLGTDITDLDFGLFSDDLDSDISLDIVTAPLICNEFIKVWISIKNLGIEQQAGTVELSFDKLFSFADSELTWTEIDSTTFSLHFDDLQYTESKRLSVTLAAPSEDHLGEFYTFSTTLESDDSTVSKEQQIESELLCAFDPNDKLAYPIGKSEGNRSLIENPIEYTIRFQNLGNYPARKVVLIDTLDEHLDVNTFELISYSHEVYTTIVDRNVVIFKFEDINLPYASMDEAGSNGYIKYSIQPKSDLANNTVVYNQATIYFDYNAGITTNTTENILLHELTSLESLDEQEENNFLVYPNPTTGLLNIANREQTSSSYHLRVTDIKGLTVLEKSMVDLPATIDLEENGIYFLSLSNGQSVYSFKVIMLK